MGRYLHKWTEEEKQFLKDNIKGISYRKMTDLFNNHFGYKFSYERIKGAISRYNLQNGRDGTFKKNHRPWNKGTKGLTSSNKTSFKKGHKPKNTVPVGTELLKADGYLYVKIGEPNKWKQKHYLVWEKHNGPIPNNHVILFADGNTENTNINNLILISRHQLLILNRKGLIQDDRELTKTAVNIAKVYEKISKRRK